MKELGATFNALLQDKRVRAEQSKYEAIQRQRGSVINRYKRAYQEFLDLEAGLQSAKRWYAEMKETVESLEKNVEAFVNNRRAEGAQLLNQIEQDRTANKNAQAELERERLKGLMERMAIQPRLHDQCQLRSSRRAMPLGILRLTFKGNIKSPIRLRQIKSRHLRTVTRPSLLHPHQQHLRMRRQSAPTASQRLTHTIQANTDEIPDLRPLRRIKRPLGLRQCAAQLLPHLVRPASRRITRCTAGRLLPRLPRPASRRITRLTADRLLPRLPRPASCRITRLTATIKERPQHKVHLQQFQVTYRKALYRRLRHPVHRPLAHSRRFISVSQSTNTTARQARMPGVRILGRRSHSKIPTRGLGSVNGNSISFKAMSGSLSLVVGCCFLSPVVSYHIHKSIGLVGVLGVINVLCRCLRSRLWLSKVRRAGEYKVHATFFAKSIAYLQSCGSLHAPSVTNFGAFLGAMY
jgi:ALIX V-shaped domain binding to HIV